MAEAPAVLIQGVPVASLDLEGLFFQVDAALAGGGRATVMYANVHVLNQAAREPRLTGALQRADLVYCDGEGVRLAARLLGQRLPARMTGADFLVPLARRLSAAGRSIFWLGGRPGVARSATEKLSREAPGLAISGCADGFFAKEGQETLAVIGRVNQSRPDILFVGLGTPTQELWVDQHRHLLDVPLVWCIGATADFLAGEVPRAPRWMGEHGLEWLFRLGVEPRRMFGRYVLGNPRFLARVGLEAARRRLGPR